MLVLFIYLFDFVIFYWNLKTNAYYKIDFRHLWCGVTQHLTTYKKILQEQTQKS